LEQKVDLLEMGVNMLERYVEHWKEPDKEYRIIASEQHFSVPIGTFNGKRVWYVGTVDGVWQHLPPARSGSPSTRRQRRSAGMRSPSTSRLVPTGRSRLDGCD
jgi:hypothetical protein